MLGRELGRPGERVTTLRLDALKPEQVDMLTLVLVGSSASRRVAGRVYTPRGYANKTVTQD